MEQPITPEEQQQIDQLTDAVASDLAKGATPATVAAALVKSGWDQANAEQFVANVQSAMNAYRASPEGHAAILEAKRARHRRNMTVGGLWCVGGTAVTLITYTAASSGGGTYVVAWGAILFGALQFLAGLYGSLRDG
jgi:hypothetical protein